MVSTRKENLLYKDAAGSSFSEGPYIFVSLDLYSDLCGDEASWSGFAAKPADGREQTGFFDRGKRKNNLSDSWNTANALNDIGDGHLFQKRKAEALHSAKHGAMPRVTTNLNVLKEETDNDDESAPPQARDLQAALDSLEKGSESTLNEVTAVQVFIQ